VTRTDRAKVSIGLPVFNGEKTVDRSITSILDQTYTDFELIIADNKSSDSTEDICRGLARLDSRICYIRHAAHMSGMANYKHVLEKATGRYFMWHACDDYRSQNYVEENYKYLMSRSDCIGSASPNCFDGQENDPDLWVRFSLEGSTYIRIRKFMDNAFSSHGIFYGLFRRAALQMITWPGRQPLGVDWGIIATILLGGSIARIDRGLFISGRGGVSEAPGGISTFQYTVLDRVFPFQRYAKWVLRALVGCDQMTVIEKTLVARELLRLNWKYKFRSD